MTAEWKLKLTHSAQTLSIALNVFALAIIFTPLGLAGVGILRFVGAIIAVDFLAEIAKLIFVPHNPNPLRAKWEGSARTASAMLNLIALGLILLPLGMTNSTILTVVGIIVLIDFAIEVVEWVLMK